MAKVVNLPSATGRQKQRQNEQRQNANERQQRLFDLADSVLESQIKELAAATNVEEVQRITFDHESNEVDIAVREAKHPVDGHAEPCFDSYTVAALKRFLKARFNGLKRDRERELLRGSAQASSGPGQAPYYDWTADLIRNDKGKIVGNVANLTLMLRHHPDWQGVLSYNEFNGHVVIRQQPPWGNEKPDASWTQQHTTQACVWFCRNGMDNPSKEKVIDAVQVVARENAFHPVRDYSTPSFGMGYLGSGSRHTSG